MQDLEHSELGKEVPSMADIIDLNFKVVNGSIPLGWFVALD